VQTEENEQQYLRAMLQRLESVKPHELLVTSDSKAWEVLPGSMLARDDAKTNPYNVSHLAWQALGVGVDHLHCLRSTLIGDQQGDHLTVTLHIYAQATLLRGAFENSARAVWLLGSTNRLVRVQRRLSLQADSNNHSDRMHQLMSAVPARTPEVRKKQIIDLAIAAGTSPGDVRNRLKFVGFKNLVRCAGDESGIGADQAEAVWSACSAVAHGDVHSLSFLEREMVKQQENAVIHRLTGDPKILLWATTLSVQMIEHGFKLYEKGRMPPF
jgi:hypothetical protein